MMRAILWVIRWPFAVCVLTGVLVFVLIEAIASTESEGLKVWWELTLDTLWFSAEDR